MGWPAAAGAPRTGSAGQPIAVRRVRSPPTPERHGLAMDEPTRVDLTPAAAALLEKLTAQHGPLMFHQSGGCCDGSSPMCYPDGDLLTGDADIHLGDLAVPGLDRPVPFWMSVSQYEYWSTPISRWMSCRAGAAGSRWRHPRASGS